MASNNLIEFIRGWAVQRRLGPRRAITIATLANAVALVIGINLMMIGYARRPTIVSGLAPWEMYLSFSVLVAGVLAPSTAVLIGFWSRLDDEIPHQRHLPPILMATASVLLGEVICSFVLCLLVVSIGLMDGDHEGGSVLVVMMIGVYLVASLVPGGLACLLGAILGVMPHRLLSNANYGGALKSPGDPEYKADGRVTIWRWALLSLATLLVVVLLVLSSIVPVPDRIHATGAQMARAAVISLAAWPFLLGIAWACLASVGISFLWNFDHRDIRSTVTVVAWALAAFFAIWSIHIWNSYAWP